MGYEFRLTEIRHQEKVGREGKLVVHIAGENTGVAPFYYPWPVEIALLDARGLSVTAARLPTDIRTWLPGKFQATAAAQLPAPPGRYTLALRIQNPWKGGQSLRFANALPQHQGWTALSKIIVMG